MENTNQIPKSNKNYTGLVVTLTIVINGLIAVLFFMDGIGAEASFDVTLLPMLNAIYNSFTTVFLFAALYAILKKNVKVHRRFIYAALTTTTLFLVTYVAHHLLADSTTYGGDGILQTVYYFILLTHIPLAAIIVPLVLLSVIWGYTNQVKKHKKIVRWTMPLWLYVSITGVLIYILISPYYG
ncbi:putative heme biosynthesis related protein [Geomicrobium sp. JCM 19037]|uniref:DUF420 domain-containing protein n=1 Tax=unclassified Geomicrobium TaxID=2628951 RepID=UPI00045F49EB|nr:DUF420 domain-containing protein [Geomicrobium sp. JCM 19037]GAK04084.1 putative heme biosynthesis related protein [Geomicrobium sp. JCM 19037]GAK14235.1 LOW QUALITY PROTEIN: putative heme biosynthesis related protein [Geomicrobium sp. JCM 19039]